MAKTRCARGLATVTAALTIVAAGTTPILDSRANTLNNWLGTSNYETVKVDGENVGDGTYFDSEYSSLDEVIQAATDLATEIAGEGTVLLKNNGALPLNSEKEAVTLWGLNSECPVLGGYLGSAVDVNTEAGQTTVGIKDALRSSGFTLNQKMIDFYGSSVADPYRMQAVSSLPWMSSSFGHALSPSFGPAYEGPTAYNIGEAPASLYDESLLASADGTAAVVMISRDSTEGSDYGQEMKATDPGDSFERPLALSDYERQVLELAKAHSSKVIVLINSSSQVELGELKNDAGIDAILWVGQPGMVGFNGVANVLSGAVNPSGHLPDTYAANINSDPSTKNFGVYLYTNNSTVSTDLAASDMADWYVVYNEGIYAGYKYYETRYEDAVLGRFNAGADIGSTTGSGWNYADEMVYPFGYGLSYTTFEQKLENISVNVGGTGTATVNVVNTGNIAGKCAVELYVQAPYTEGGVEKAAIQLLDFGKTDVLQPGESETVTIEFDPRYMASYDETAQKADGTMGAWILDAGDYFFTVANGAHEAINNVLAKKLGTTEGLTVITDDETISGDNVQTWHLNERDIETYSENVENQLQDCDINKLIPGTVEYMTRSDWTKGWETVTDITPTDAMLVDLKNERYSLSANGDGVTWGADNGLKLIDFIQTDENGNYAGVVDINDPNWDKLVEQVSFDDALNFIENNGEGLQSIQSIGYPANGNNDGPIGFIYGQVPGYFVKWSNGSASEPTYVAETDDKANWSMSVMPTEPVVAATFNKKLVEREGEMLGEQSIWANLPSIMAPGLNVHRNAYNGRNHEYYSEDSMLSNHMGVAVTTGASHKGLMTEVKHFAFNQQEYDRTGISTFFNEQAARENELRSFQGALEGNTAMSIMTPFNRAGTVWAGAHEGLLTNIVRNEWGFTGWITTDMINGADYQNWKDAISAGSSETLSNRKTWAESRWNTMDANRDLILSDTAFQQKMQQGLKYTFYTTVRSNAVNGITSNTEMVYVQTWWQKAIRWTTYGLGAVTVLLAALYICLEVKQSKKNSKRGA